VYVIEKPAVDPRLQHRYCLIVKQHVRKASNLAAGLRVNTKDGARRKTRKQTARPGVAVTGQAVATERTPQQRAQKAAEVAAGRFYDNASLDLPTLGAPLLQRARAATAETCQRYILCVHDQSPLHYTHHGAKADRTTMYNKHDLGYDMASAVVLSDRDGAPLGVPYLALSAATGVHSTRRTTPLLSRPWVDELNRTMGYLQAQAFTLPLVHIIDREADKVLHLRRFARCDRLVLIRANDQRRVQHEGQSRLLRDVEATVAGQFKFARYITYQGQKAAQYVAETAVVLTEPARLMRQRDGRVVQRSIPGAPLPLRLVLAQVRDEQGNVMATWRLWTNLPASVDAATVALWYYWRWRIESFHKLLKSAGQEVEHWQQTNVERIARRLLLAVQACVIVWELSQSETAEAENLRGLLWRLSGHSGRPGTTPTAPALLAGCWNLLAIIDALDDYTVAELREQAATLYTMLGLTLN
jgi:hypothetical protein